MLFRSWESVAKDGEFDFLPDRLPSRQGDKLFAEAFPQEKLASSVVLVVSRATAEISSEERHQAADLLVTKLRALIDQTSANEATENARSTGAALINRVRSPNDEVTGPLLVSADRRAMLIAVSLRSDMMDMRNREVVELIEGVVREVQKEDRKSTRLNSSHT